MRGRPPAEFQTGACKVCGGTVAARNLCWPHYQQQRRERLRPSPCEDGKPHEWMVMGRCRVCGVERRR